MIYHLQYKKKKVDLNYHKYVGMGLFPRDSKTFETAVVNEPSVFEPPKFYCLYYTYLRVALGLFGYC